MFWIHTGRHHRTNVNWTVVLSCTRYIPYVIFIVTLKIYVLCTLISRRQQHLDEIAEYDLENSNNPLDRDHLKKLEHISPPSTRTSTSTEEPGWREKVEVLARLNDTTILPSATNRTPETLWLFFNRVPRTGGETLVALLKKLSTNLDFEHQSHVYRTPWQRLLTTDEQKHLASWFEYNFWPKSYDRFALNINFTQVRSTYVRQRPAYITLLRDPVAQFESHFYFKRHDPTRVKLEMALRDRHQPGSGRKWYWKTLESCILEDDPECDFKNGTRDFTTAIPFLCGQIPECVEFGNTWALQRSKYQLEYEYAAVGILEDWNATLTVFDHYLPLFFQGAPEVYWGSEFDEQFLNKRPKKIKPLSEKAVSVLKNKLSAEYELYQMARQRLRLQYAAVEGRYRVTTTLQPYKKEGLSNWDRLDIELSRAYGTSKSHPLRSQGDWALIK
ncbi:heparan sulfate 2-O-sulfotransferase 1-like [Oratosquilla oratoria]|uniref:heparan sulfate 2-O-sulfotransferase 1-like n=1 Tax=Oratosquilla oratoria TaxID=337810 RepID=UPI003F764288